jgi:hypothetical protein
VDVIGNQGIEYNNGYPNFSPIAKAEVRVSRISTDRTANFKEADVKLAEKLGVSRKDVTRMRKQEKLTWHEVEDMRTMQLVPTVPYGKLGHIGGVGEAKRLQ